MRRAGEGGRAERRRRAGAGRRIAWGAAMALAVLGACRRDEVTHFRVMKEPEAAAMPAGLDSMPPGTGGGMPGGMPPGMAGDVPPPPSMQGGGLAWTLPKGWTETRGAGGMRYATVKPSKPSVPGKAEVSVIVLPGPAGGELANVNRWRNQIGLAPLDDAGLAGARTTVKAPAGPISVYDFRAPERNSRVVAGLTVKDGNTWFVKLAGDADAVGAARPGFMNLLTSLRFDATTP